MTERDFFECLKPRYNGNDFALVPQVRNQTGFTRRVRTADAIAISLFPSRGIDVHGFEFKDSRTDWLKELKEPEKSEEIGRFCAFWWLVVSDPKHFQPDELPAAWGAMHAVDGAVKVLKKAPRRDVQEPSWVFVAAVLRAAKDFVTSEVEIQRRIAAAVSKAEEGRYAAICRAREDGQKHAQNQLAEYAASVSEFEKASGVSITGWRGWHGANTAEKVGAAVRFVMDGGVEKLQAELRAISATCDRVKQAAESVLDIEKAKVAA